jgi:2-iminobutanoate/2-iminopropanoate deaminase
MKRPLSTDKAPAAIGPYSQAIAVPAGELIFCSGQIPLDPATGNLVAYDITVQTTQVIDNIENLLAAGGCTLKDVVKSTVFLRNMSDFAKMNEVYAARFTGEHPARSTIEVARLPKDSLVEIEVIAAKR